MLGSQANGKLEKNHKSVIQMLYKFNVFYLMGGGLDDNC